MAARKRQVDKDGNIFQFGKVVRVERALATARDASPRWHVFKLTDCKDDPDTSLDERWEFVADYGETELGVLPAKAAERAAALAEKE